MTIKSIHVKNFKSFKELQVELGKFNILIGANASGKSNFVQVLKFLRDIARDGLENVIAMQGGPEYLTNLNVGTAENLSVEAVISQLGKSPMYHIGTSEADGSAVFAVPLEAAYSFSVAFSKNVSDFEVLDDRLTLKSEFGAFELEDGYARPQEVLGQGEVLLFRDGNKIRASLTLPKGLSSDEYRIEISAWHLESLERTASHHSLILSDSREVVRPAFRDIATYDFDPKLPKKGTPITGKADLEEDGSNLAIVLKNIIGDADRKRKLEDFLGDLLPFVANLEVEKFADKSLLFSLRETYVKKQSLPASLISDGTISVTALVAALYFEKKPVAVIEEPERNIHPSLISKVVGMMKDASKSKQIMVTTHNPEVVRHADIGDVLLVSRNGEGFSTISRPSENNEVKVFLQNEMGLEELFVENLLHA